MPTVRELAAAAEAGRLAAELVELQKTFAIYFVADLIALNEVHKGNPKGFDKEVAQWQARLELIRRGLLAPLLAEEDPTYRGKFEVFFNADRKLPDMQAAMDMNAEATARALDESISAFSTATSVIEYAKSVVKGNPADPRVKALRDAATFLSGPAAPAA